MQRIDPSQLVNPQEIRATVTGPGTANTLVILDGQFTVPANQLASSWRETYLLTIGPVFSLQQFVKASANAQVVSWRILQHHAQENIFHVYVANVDADWDDESGNVELTVEAGANAAAGAVGQILAISYHITVLAAL